MIDFRQNALNFVILVFLPFFFPAPFPFGKAGVLMKERPPDHRDYIDAFQIIWQNDMPSPPPAPEREKRLSSCRGRIVANPQEVGHSKQQLTIVSSMSFQVPAMLWLNTGASARAPRLPGSLWAKSHAFSHPQPSFHVFPIQKELVNPETGA